MPDIIYHLLVQYSLECALDVFPRRLGLRDDTAEFFHLYVEVGGPSGRTLEKFICYFCIIVRNCLWQLKLQVTRWGPRRFD